MKKYSQFLPFGWNGENLSVFPGSKLGEWEWVSRILRNGRKRL